MKHFTYPIFICLTFLALVGCATVKMVPGGHDPVNTPFAMEENFDFWFFGTVGGPIQYDASFLCPKQNLAKIEIGYSGEDILISTFLLGIYTPKTARFWCVP